MNRSTLRTAAFALLAGLCGCRSCKNERPYVPYSVEDGPSSSLDAASDATPEAAAAAPGSEAALIAPPSATRWTVEGLDLVAPEGREYAVAIVRDFDNDGQKDALAVTRTVTDAGKPETVQLELVHYANKNGALAAKALASLPSVNASAACPPIVRLERTGDRSLAAELGSSCTDGRGGTRTIFVVRVGPSPVVAYEAIVQDPPSAPKLVIDVDGADRDGDGIEDIGLRFTVEGGGPPFEPGPRLSAKLAFFDRPAGPSRDPDEPEASLKAIAQRAATKAKSKERAEVPILVQQMRALYRAMCDEGGAARLTKARGGGAVSCGASRQLEDAGVAEVRALVGMSDAIRAFAAADVAQSPPATKTAAKTTELQALLDQVAPVRAARSVRTAAASVEAARGRHPEWGALAFDPHGTLLVRGAGRVTKLDPDTGTEEATDMPAWSVQVLSPDAKSRWLEAYHACEGVALRSTFAPTGGDGDVRDVLMPIAPRLGARCSGARGEAAATLPLAWGPRGLEAIVAGQLVLVKPEEASAISLVAPLDQVPPLGSPRSPSGRSLAVATSRGVLVRSDKTVLLKSADFEPYVELRSCTVSDDGLRVACVRRGKVVVAVLDGSS